MIEGAPTQSWIKGKLPIETFPRNLAELLVNINQPRKRSKPFEYKTGFYRNKVNGEGKCRICNQKKSAEEFPSRHGLICIACKPLDKRTKENNPGGNNKTGKNGRKRV